MHVVLIRGVDVWLNTRTDAKLAAAVQNALQTLLPQICAEIREEFRTGSGPSSSGGNPPPVTIHTWLERFNKKKPRLFEKATAPVDAENWISHMEKIFDVMGFEDAFMTRLAVYKFEGDALAWWKAYKQAKGGDVWLITMTWAEFKELFFLQFFPRAEQERLKREYHSIRQTDTETSTKFMQRFFRLTGFLRANALQTLLPQIRVEIREEFRTSSGPSGSGRNPPSATTPVDAENWISHMENIFDVIGCEDAFKTRLAMYKFVGDALAWWKAYKQAKGGDVWLITVTWAEFKELFFLQFFPRAEQERLKREYHSIRQTDTETSTKFMQRFL
nr:zinc finger, CCHC-type, retrotransposon Gag domain protein [Tanacetum cinerariifolium]